MAATLICHADKSRIKILGTHYLNFSCFWCSEHSVAVNRKADRALRKFPGPLLLALFLCLALPPAVLRAADKSEVELTNFAFANYLGSGFYSSSNVNLFIVKIPF